MAKTDHVTTNSADIRPFVRLRTLGGRWTNELGSELELHNTDGFLSGRYHSTVGTAQHAEPLVGFCTPLTGTGIVAFGFVVRWDEAGSVTTWTGRYDGDTDRLQTTWVLESTSPSETSWRSLQLGQDVFRRAG